MHRCAPLSRLPLLFWLAVACGGEPASKGAPPAAAAAPAPTAPAEIDVAVRTIDSEDLQALLTEDQERARVVNFWATWCGPCVAEMPEFVAFAGAHPEIDVVLVSLDLPSVHSTAVVPFARRHRLLGVDVARLDDPDPGAALSEVLPSWPFAIPYTVVVDADGTRRKTFARPVALRDLEAALTAELR